MRLLTVALNAEHDLVLARQRVRQVASLLGLDQGAQTRLTTAVSEIARNAFQYGTEGVIEIRLERRTDHAVLWVSVHDRGPGINDIDEILAGRYRSSTGLGLGLVGARRLVDHFKVTSEPGNTQIDLGQVLVGPIDDRGLARALDQLGSTPPGDAFAEVLLQNQELLQAQHKLAEVNRELASADRAKDQFLAMLGHELRNLLNALRSSLEVLQRDPEAEIRQRMEKIAVRQTEHLRRLVEDLLDASQINRGRLEVRALPVDLAREIDGLLASWREEVASAGLRLRIDRPVEPMWVHADPTRLAQIVGNLLSNACKFTDPGGEIRVMMERVTLDRERVDPVMTEGGGDQVRLVVADTGCGMDAEALDKVFAPFAQMEEARRRMTGGLGLGLAIVKGLVTSHGGRLYAESDGLGHGSRFIIELPAIDEPEDAEPLAPIVRMPESLRVLLVDDHRASTEGLAELLRLEGHEVEVAVDGPSALERARTFAPDVVLCDLGLPGMDGFEVARIMRGEKGQDFRMFALSGFADPASKQRAVDAGFDAHLSKPINVNDLMSRLVGEDEP